MGLIRLILATAVVMAHTTSNEILQFCGSKMAVGYFFLLSGFFSQEVSLKYPDGFNFFKGRIVRIFPLYFLVLLIVGLDTNSFKVNYDIYESLNVLEKLLIIFTNVSIIFQDLFLFYDLKSKTLIYDLAASSRVYLLMLIPQAWSLSLELYNYFVFSFLIKSKKIYITVLVFFSLAVKIYLVVNKIQLDPWSYRFYFAELYLFFLGVLASFYKEKIRVCDGVFSYFALLIIVLVVKTESPILQLASYLLFAFLVVQTAQKSLLPSKVDRFLGDLSYAVYLIHIYVLTVFVPNNTKLENNTIVYDNLSKLVLVYLFSVFLVFIEKKIRNKLENILKVRKTKEYS